MSGTLNKVMLIGHLGDEVKLHYFEGGNCIGRFPIATNESYTNRQTGEKVTNTEWHNIVAWRKLAEICGQYLQKGRLVFIEGRIQTREWDDRDGNKRRTTEIVASNMQMLGSRGQDDGRAEGPDQQKEETSMEIGITDDDIPF